MQPTYKQNCLSCRYYTIQDKQTGFCRIEPLTSKDKKGEKPQVQADNLCDSWRDCGQTYFIRIGWLKKLAEKEAG